jgi:2-polyprenyl-3-methyl-5-hydroxy-6-metoxy-1,4-benzoquinol methylase
MAIGHIIGALSLPPGSSILEMGAGWGNTSIFLAQMGYEVTVVDINPKYGELMKNRAAASGVSVSFLCTSFDETASLGRKFDCVLFYESFHHSYDHLALLDLIREALLNPGGKLALAGEPVNEALPYDWGLNPVGEALWQIRTHGWFELVFRESYLLRTLREKGFAVAKHDLQNNPHGTTYICQFDSSQD